MFSLFSSHSFAEKYAVENIDKFKMNKDNKLDCNIYNENFSKIKYFGEVIKNDNIDTDWYLFDAWGIKHKRGIEKNYKHGKSLGGCVKKDGTGYYYTAVKSFSAKAGKKQSWLNITSVIGKRAWIASEGNIHGKSNKNFPISIGEIKKFQLAYEMNKGSAKVLKKNGFKVEGKLKSEIVFKKKRYSYILYGKIL